MWLEAILLILTIDTLDSSRKKKSENQNSKESSTDVKSGDAELNQNQRNI